MKLRFDESVDTAVLTGLVSELAGDEDVKGLLVLAGDANGWTAEMVNPILQSLKKPVFGGVFPQVIYGRKNYEKGVLVVGLPVAPEIAIIEGLSDSNADYDAQLEPLVEQWASASTEQETLVVLVDGLSQRIAALVQALFSNFGLDRNFIGGGAGSLSFVQRPCILTPRGLLADSAVVVRLPLGMGVGVAHGWEPISEGMRVTESNRNVIQSLDWRPAFEVYRELVEAHSGKKFADNNFFDIAKCYPFGIAKMGAELVVRDPLMTDPNGGLVCVGEVPQNCVVKLLSGSPESLIAAAAQARTLAEESVPSATGGGETAFLIDCISRVLYLGDQIVDELESVSGDKALFGALTLGEIANSGKDYLEFYNKTSVLGLFS